MTKTWFWATNLFFIQQTKDLLLDDKTDLVLGGTSNNEEDSELGGISSIKKKLELGDEGVEQKDSKRDQSV